jgi:glyoxylase-like metal-dependent hydrolase (beta-lactamase superfamily II)
MNLEDHLGDILRKARAMSGASAADVARAAGLSEAELGALEESRIIGKRPNLGAVAGLLGLHPGKLEGIANGWLPAAKDLSTWRELRAFTTNDGGMAVNAYLIWDEVTRDAALFDTGWNVLDALAEIESNQLVLRHLFITHGHHDHVAAVDDVRAAFPKVRLHCRARSVPLDQRNRQGECVQLGSLRITHRETPGHAEDGVTYIVGHWPEDAPQVAIVGDAIFAGSVGRGNQSWELALEKVREQILTLPPDTLLCPGHGPLTTVAEEQAHNPFF